jgi:hypothetical protein
MILTPIIYSKKFKTIPLADVINLFRNFFMNFDSNQATMIPTKFCQLAGLFADWLIANGKPILGVKPLKLAVIKFRSSEDEFSTLNLEFAKLCIKSKCYPQSLDIIKCPVTTYKEHTKPLTIIVYNYYRGLLFTGLKDYESAINCFKCAISQPSYILHSAALESYKKLALLSLIVDGEVSCSN